MIINEIIKQKDGKYQIIFSHSTTEKERNAFEDFMGRFVVKEKAQKVLIKWRNKITSRGLTQEQFEDMMKEIGLK